MVITFSTTSNDFIEQFSKDKESAKEFARLS